MTEAAVLASRQAIEARADALFNSDYRRLLVRTDRLFGGLQ
jgi:hypothetical protein